MIYRNEKQSRVYLPRIDVPVCRIGHLRFGVDPRPVEIGAIAGVIAGYKYRV